MYSDIKPRTKRAATPLLTAAPSEAGGERPLGEDGGFHLMSGKQEKGGGVRDGRRQIKSAFCPPGSKGAASTDSEYEVFSFSDTQTSGLCSPGHMGQSTCPLCPPSCLSSPTFLSLLTQASTSASRNPKDPEIFQLSGGNCRNEGATHIRPNMEGNSEGGGSRWHQSRH